MTDSPNITRDELLELAFADAMGVLDTVEPSLLQASSASGTAATATIRRAVVEGVRRADMAHSVPCRPGRSRRT